MKDISYIYAGSTFPEVSIKPINYKPDYFNLEFNLESEEFYDLRKKNNFHPFRINESSEEEKLEIQKFFDANKETFYFLFNDRELIGSILYLNDYIQSLVVSSGYQGKGYGKQLTMFAINKILNSGFNSVKLNILEGNLKAIELYESLGFKRIE